MKTINQVLLAFVFVAFSTVGFAQSQTTIPTSTVKLNDDIRFIDFTDNDEEEEEEMDERYYIIEVLRTHQESNSSCPLVPHEQYEYTKAVYTKH